MSVTIAMTTCLDDLKLVAMSACDTLSKSQLQEQFFAIKLEESIVKYSTIDQEERDTPDHNDLCQDFEEFFIDFLSSF
jgi:hypothetical protein